MLFKINLTKRVRRRKRPDGSTVNQTRYVLNYRDPATGARRQEFFSRLADAQVRQNDLVVMVDQGEPVNPKSVPSVADALDHWLADKDGKVKSTTFASYRAVVAWIRGPALVGGRARRDLYRDTGRVPRGATLLPLLGKTSDDAVVTDRGDEPDRGQQPQVTGRRHDEHAGDHDRVGDRADQCRERGGDQWRLFVGESAGRDHRQWVQHGRTDREHRAIGKPVERGPHDDECADEAAGDHRPLARRRPLAERERRDRQQDRGVAEEDRHRIRDRHPRHGHEEASGGEAHAPATRELPPRVAGPEAAPAISQQGERHDRECIDDVACPDDLEHRQPRGQQFRDRIHQRQERQRRDEDQVAATDVELTGT